jgi:hypothetical protein
MPGLFTCVQNAAVATQNKKIGAHVKKTIAALENVKKTHASYNASYNAQEGPKDSHVLNFLEALAEYNRLDSDLSYITFALDNCKSDFVNALVEVREWSHASLKAAIKMLRVLPKVGKIKRASICL